jgi:predicted AAA+ superfamily ATPase
LPCLLKRQSYVKKNNILDVFEHIWRGGMPQVLRADAEQRREYCDSYIDTYLMRDIAEAGGITDTVRFRRFQVNFNTLANAAGISQPTAKQWMQVLQGLGIIYLLQPYANNELKRLGKTPKLYFCDTGLCAHLSMWLTQDTLMNGGASGHFFENHVVIELLKHYAYAKAKASLSYYHDANAKEIDLFVEENNRIHPFEIKKSASPDRREVRKFSLLDKTQLERSYGGIVCMCEEVIPIDGMNCFIPCNLI